MITYYGSRLSPNQVETSEGFLICRNVPIARIGEQAYYAYELQLDGEPNREITVHRHEEDVFDKATLASFEGKPVTDTHPDGFVDTSNYKDLAKGHVQNVRREGDYIMADLYINDPKLIEEIRSGKKREVSCGYLCTYIPEGGDYKQTKIRGNHVAVVQKGRAGHEVAIQDAAAGAAEKGRTLMSKFKEVLAAFGMAAKDAEPDDIKALAELTSLAMDAQEDEPAEKAQESVPAEGEEKEVTEKVEKIEKEETSDEDGDLGAKIDKLIEMVAALAKGEAKDAEPEKEEEESEVIEEEKTEDEDDEEAPEDELTDDAMALMKAINGIRSTADRRRVAKAFFAATASDSMGEIFKAAGSAAQKGGKRSYEAMCAESEAAYAARNPHMKKEDR